MTEKITNAITSEVVSQLVVYSMEFAKENKIAPEIVAEFAGRIQHLILEDVRRRLDAHFKALEAVGERIDVVTDHLKGEQNNES